MTQLERFAELAMVEFIRKLDSTDADITDPQAWGKIAGFAWGLAQVMVALDPQAQPSGAEAQAVSTNQPKPA